MTTIEHKECDGCGKEVSKSRSKTEGWIDLWGSIEIAVGKKRSRDKYTRLDFCSTKCMVDYFSEEWIECLGKGDLPNGFEEW